MTASPAKFFFGFLIVSIVLWMIFIELLSAGLTSEKQSTVPADDPPHDLNLSANLYIALRKLRALLVKECPDGVMQYHILGVKVIKYGDQLLATIESTVNEYYGTSKKDAIVNKDSPESGKRRRDKNISPNVGEDDDFEVSPSQSYQKPVRDKSNEVAHGDYVDGDGEGMVMDKLDFDFDIEDDGSKIRPEGRVLPW